MLKHATPRISPCLASPETSSHHLKNLTLSTSSRFPDQRGQTTISSTTPQLYIDLPTHSEPTLKLSPSTYSERGVDCEGIVSSPLYALRKGTTHSDRLRFGGFLGGKILSLGSLTSSEGGTGPVITYGRAIVRRGLSFTSKKTPDSVSVRSVKSDIQESKSGELQGHQKIVSKTDSLMVLPTTIAATINHTKDKDSKVENLAPERKEEKSIALNNSKNLPLADHIANETPSSDSKQSSVCSSNKKMYVLSQTDHPIIKSLLRLPGVYNHIPVPENAPFDTPHLLSPDTLSLNYPDSFGTSNSGRTSSRSWSSNASSNTNNTNNSSTSNCSSTSEPTSTMLKIFTNCLRSNIEYKTLNIGSRVTCRQLINLLLSKMRLKHRDPNLFYVTMEVTVRRWSGVPDRVLLVLEDSARPAQLASCRPSGDVKFVLQMRRGGVIKINDTVLMPGSQYKSLLLSYRTTSEEAVQLLLNCYGRRESKIYYALHEVCQTPFYNDRRLDTFEKPLEVKAEWPRNKKAKYIFVLRRNMTQALSLRKLSMRTFATTTMEDDQTWRNNCMTTNKPKRILENLNLEQTVIDCTSTTPVIKTYLSKEFESEFPFKNFMEVNNPRQRNRQRSLSLGKELEVVCALPAVAKESTDEEHEIVKNNEKKETLNSNYVANTIQHLNPNSKSSVEREEPQNDPRESKQLWKYTTDESDNYLSHDKLSEISKQNPQYYLLDQRPTVTKHPTSPKIQKEIWPKVKIAECKIVSTSAVQTELTCIPLKGPRIKHRWNSVETLIPPEYSPSINKDKKSKNEITVQNVQSKKETHSNGKQCHCEECFYI